MNLSESQKTYITEVLGVKGIIMPHGFNKPSGSQAIGQSGNRAVSEAAAPVGTNLTPSSWEFFLLNKQPKNEKSKLLQDNILKAIQVRDVKFHDSKATNDKSGFGILFGQDEFNELFSDSQFQPGHFIQDAGITWLCTLSLDSMISGSPGEINNSKRAVWGHLKKMKEKLGS